MTILTSRPLTFRSLVKLEVEPGDSPRFNLVALGTTAKRSGVGLWGRTRRSQGSLRQLIREAAQGVRGGMATLSKPAASPSQRERKIATVNLQKLINQMHANSQLHVDYQH